MTSVTQPVYFLLTDDLEENLLSLEGLLRRDGLVLLKARSGVEALEILLQHDIALALLDVQMPDMDGFELAELMRGTERTRRVPIIFLTAGNADRGRRFRGYEAGAVDFLHKPIEPDVLRSKADVFFELYRQRQQIAAQRDELKSYTDALQEADRRKDEFLATLAHELRNPLAPIRNGLQILRMSSPGSDTRAIRDMMERQLVHLVRLIDDLLDVSRVSQGKIDLRRERIEVRDILQSAVEASQPLIDAAGHELVVEAGNEHLWVDADLTRLAQALSNLMNNAAKYTPDGGRISVTVRHENDDAVIAVKDNGLGIPPDMLGSVFHLFTQIDRNMDRAKGGLGIGLALVKQLVEMHGGSISAASEGVGKGSTFSLRLPLAASEPIAAPPELEQQTDTATQPLRVLVVDDHVEVAQTVGWMLEAIGHDYELVHDGRLALEAAHVFHPDAVLLDIGMPGMDGYAVCRAFRQDPAFKDTLIIAQTGWGQSRDRQQASEAGFDYHVVKPVDFDELTRILSKNPRESADPAGIDAKGPRD